MNPPIFTLERVDTPLGKMLIVTDEAHQLRALDWQDYESRMHELLRRQYRSNPPQLMEVQHASAATQALHAYFAGELDILSTLPVAFGGTEFQQAVWTALRSIPRGTTVSYGELALSIGKPAAVRAVGLANGANPIGVVVPCHRVIGSNRSLTGYAGGLHRKQWLLAHECALSRTLL